MCTASVCLHMPFLHMLMPFSVNLETFPNNCRGSDGMSDRDSVRDVRQVVADHCDLGLER